MIFFKILKYIFIIIYLNCSSFEIISPGIDSNSELELITYKNKSSYVKIHDELKVRAFKIMSEKDFADILSDENNVLFGGEPLFDTENFNLIKYEFYIISINIPEEFSSIDLSKFSINIGKLLPDKKYPYIYDYIILSKFKNGIAGSMEAMSISTDTFPIKPENRYNNRNKSSSYGYTLIKYARTVRFLCAFKKTDLIGNTFPLIFSSNSDFEAKFSRNFEIQN